MYLASDTKIVTDGQQEKITATGGVLWSGMEQHYVAVHNEEQLCAEDFGKLSLNSVLKLSKSLEGH